MVVSKIAYLPFAVSFCLCTTETTNTSDILSPNIVLFVLQFFRFFFNFINFYSTKAKLFFCFYIFWNLIYLFVLKICGMFISNFNWSKTPVLLCSEKKSCMISQKSRALSDFLKITYDNHNAQKWSVFLNTLYICHIWLII